MPDKSENVQLFQFSFNNIVEHYLQSWIKIKKQRSDSCRKKLKDRGTPDTEDIGEAQF